MERSNHYESAGFFASTLRLIQGRLEALVTHMTGGEPRFEVKTPQALLGVGGTDFRSSVDEAKQVTRSEVLDGAVSVGATAAPRQSAQWLAAGFGTQVNQGRDAGAPVKLPPAPDLEGELLDHNDTSLGTLAVACEPQSMDEVPEPRF